jgi:hypothetical protein
VDEIFCPLCGKPNPIENKYCDYCLAYLEPRETGDPLIPGSETNQGGLGGHSTDEQAPAWLKKIQGSETSDDEISGEQDLGLELPAADTSDWMPGSSKKKSEVQSASSSVSPFLGGRKSDDDDEIPAWLNDALVEEGAPGDQEMEDLGGYPQRQEQEKASQLEKNIEKQAPGSHESAGPLAGLTGVLSAEPGIERIRKPKAYSTKIRISESQLEHVELLQSILEEEGQPKPLPEKGPISQQHVLRWSIALVLLVSVLWSLIFSKEQMPLPIYDEGSAEVNRLINQLPENSRILVGFDFEPGLASELDAAAYPVFDHLVTQGSLFTTISTTPTGPILAERFLQIILPKENFINGQDYVNLGYVPGGAAGLLNFIENPSGVMPYSIDGSSVWATETSEALPPVAGINEITDFEMIVLLVDDPDIARIWVEQLTPYITDPETLISLVLVTSAQLEPIVRPYFESIPQSVNGLVVGLRGGSAYARLVGGEQLPGQYWDAFGVGTFVAALLILVGGLAYYVVPELSRTVRGQEKVG